MYICQKKSYRWAAKLPGRMASPQIQTQRMNEPEAKGNTSDALSNSEPGPSGNNKPHKLSAVKQSLTTYPGSKTEVELDSEESVKKCGHCSKADADPEKPFKPCAKCHTVRYCSRDCQKAGFKLHKKTCASAAQIYTQTADLRPAPPPRAPKKDAFRGGLQKWQFDTS